MSWISYQIASSVNGDERHRYGGRAGKKEAEGPERQSLHLARVSEILSSDADQY